MYEMLPKILFIAPHESNNLMSFEVEIQNLIITKYEYLLPNLVLSLIFIHD